MPNSTQEDAKPGAAGSPEPWTLPERCTIAALAGAFVGGALSDLLATATYGGMGHGGTSTDWNSVFNNAIGLGALIGAVFGVVLTVLIFLPKRKNGSSRSLENQDSPHE